MITSLDQVTEFPLIELKYQALAKRAHPDNGGTDEAMAELNAAIEQARQSVAA